MTPNWYVTQKVPDQRIWKTVFCALCVLHRQTPSFKSGFKFQKFESGFSLWLLTYLRIDVELWEWLAFDPEPQV